MSCFFEFDKVKFTKSQQKQHQEFLIGLGKRIVEIRKNKKISQLELAYAIGMEKPNLRQIEKGKRNPTIKTLLLVAEGLGVSVIDLLKT